MSSFRAVAERRYCAVISVPFAFFVHLAESNVYSSESSRSGCGMMQKRKLLVLFSQIPYKTSFYVELVQTPVCLVCVCVISPQRECWLARDKAEFLHSGQAAWREELLGLLT